jgi:hypothetical protein
VAEHFLIAFESTGLGRRVRLYVRCKELDGSWNPPKRILFVRRTKPLPPAGRHFTDQISSF